MSRNKDKEKKRKRKRAARGKGEYARGFYGKYNPEAVQFMLPKGPPPAPPAGTVFVEPAIGGMEMRLIDEAVRYNEQHPSEVIVIDSLPAMASEPKERKHCDEYVSPRYPKCLAVWVFVERTEAWLKALVHQKFNPPCFATWKGKRVRLTMASRLGDVGITTIIGNKDGPYEHRVWLEELTDFSETP